jgi:signal transduction histidine kinase
MQGAQERGSRRGYGLGLYFSRLAVEAHGGRIGVEDVPEWATSFVARLPPPAPSESSRAA